jgi:hypothetical protein
VVVIVRVLFVELESGVSEAGLNVHPASVGSPLHERLIVPVNVPWGATVSVKVPDCPSVIVALIGFELKLKFCEATPWPEKPMICGEIAALSFRVTVPTTVEVSVGEKVRETGQTIPGWIAPQVSLAVTVGAEETRLARFSAALPQLVRCTVSVIDVPTSTCPKFTVQVSRQTEGAATAMFNLATKGWLP